MAKLTDFGVARLAGDDPLTRTGDVVGTLAYMAPEQAEGAGSARRRTSTRSASSSTRPSPAAPGPGGGPGGHGAPARREPSLPGPLPPRPPGWARASRGPRRASAARASGARSPTCTRRSAGAVLEVSDEGGTLASPALDRRLPRGTGRASAAAAAGGLAALAAAWAPVAGGATPAEALGVPVGLVGLGAATLVFVLPRVAWAALAVAIVAVVAAPPVDAPGAALVVAVGLAASPLLLPRAGRAWSAPALAPVLGIAAFARGILRPRRSGSAPARRAALGAAGFVWVALAEVLAGRDLYLGAAPGTGPPADWAGSARDAVTQALEPLGHRGALLRARVGAGRARAAVGRARPPAAADGSPRRRWAGALAAGRRRGRGDLEAGSHPRGGLAGPALAAVLAVALRWLRGPDPPPLEAPPAD